MKTIDEAEMLAQQASAFIRVIDKEHPFLEALTSEQRGNFILSFTAEFIRCTAHSHWAEEHNNPQQERLMEMLQEFLHQHQHEEDPSS